MSEASQLRKRLQEIKRIPIDKKYTWEEHQKKLKEIMEGHRPSMFQPTTVVRSEPPQGQERKRLPERRTLRFTGINTEFYRNSIKLTGKQVIGQPNAKGQSKQNQVDNSAVESEPRREKVQEEAKAVDPKSTPFADSLFKLQPIQNTSQQSNTQILPSQNNGSIFASQNSPQVLFTTQPTQHAQQQKKTGFPSIFANNKPMGNIFNQSTLFQQSKPQPAPTKEMLENPSKMFDNKGINIQKEEKKEESQKPAVSLFGGLGGSSGGLFGSVTSQDNKPAGMSLFGAKPVEPPNIKPLFGVSKEQPKPEQPKPQQLKPEQSKPEPPQENGPKGNTGVSLFGTSGGLFGSNAGGIFAGKATPVNLFDGNHHPMKSQIVINKNQQKGREAEKVSRAVSQPVVREEVFSDENSQHSVPGPEQKVVNIFEQQNSQSSDPTDSIFKPYQVKPQSQEDDKKTQKPEHEHPKIPPFAQSPTQSAAQSGIRAIDQKNSEKVEEKVTSPTKMAIGPGGKKVELPDEKFFSNPNKAKENSLFSSATNVFGGSTSLFGANKPTSQSEKNQQNKPSQPTAFSQLFLQKAATGGPFAGNPTSIFNTGNTGSLFSGSGASTGGGLFGSNLQNSLFRQQASNENEDEEGEEEEGPIEQEDNADPTKSTGHYEYTKNRVIFKEQATKLRQGSKDVMEGVIVSLEQFQESKSVFFIVRMANKCVAFTAVVVPKVTEVRKLASGPKNLELTKLMVRGAKNELILVRVQFKDEETGNRFFREVESVVKGE